MTLSILADRNGNILSISQFGDVGERVSGITKAGVYAELGQTIHEIELPKDLQNTPLLDIHKGFRIDVTGGIGHLVKR